MRITIKTQTDKKKMMRLSVITFLSLFLFYALAVLFPLISGLVEFAAFMFFVYSAYVLSRFHLTQFEYILTDGELLIYKWTGKRSTKVCHVTTSMIERVYSKSEWKAKKKTEQISSTYNYNASHLPNYYIVVIYEYCATRAAVMFSGDENMKKAIDGLLKSRENH